MGNRDFGRAKLDSVKRVQMNVI